MGKKEIYYSLDKVDVMIRFLLAYEDMTARFGLKEEDFEKCYKVMKQLEYLKKEYSKYFIESLQHCIKFDGISTDRVFEVLPSKSFIDFSKEREKELQKEQSEWFWYRSAEDLVLRRLGSHEVEEKYQKASLDDRLFLGYSEYGPTVYTSFTKREYEEDLEKIKKLIRKK